MEWTDEAAAAAVRTGDQNAFRVLVERHSHSVFRLAYRMAGNEQDAEDLVQETFLRAFRQIGQFDGRAAFKTWLYRIATNCSFDLLSARQKRREQQLASTEENGFHWLDLLSTHEPSPERVASSNQMAELFEPALNQLTPSERTAFVLRHYEGCRIEDIAQMLGIQSNAAKHTVFRAVQKLRRSLGAVLGAAR